VSNPRATFFDFNGVLVDDEHVHLEAFRDVLYPMGIKVTERADTERYLGFDDAGAFRAILIDAGRAPTEDEIRALVLAKKPRYMERIEGGLSIFPGAAELVRRRAALGPVAIVSGALEHEIRFCLARMQVDREIAFIVAADHCRASKPDPEGYLLATAELARRARGATVVAIEDSLAGVVAAKRAGLRCVGVGHSYATSELTQVGADAVADTIASVTDAMFDA
jgi:beta-phosphoglucomutase